MKISTLAITSAVIMALGVPAWAIPSADSLSGPSDHQITAIVSTANGGEIAAARYMVSRSEDGNIKAFAEQMIKEHSAVNKSTVELAAKLKMKPRKSHASRELERGAKKNMKVLKKLSGHELDRAYVYQEVIGHQSLLDTFDKSLLPNVSNGELRTLLETTRPAVAAHLAKARKLAETM